MQYRLLLLIAILSAHLQITAQVEWQPMNVGSSVQTITTLNGAIYVSSIGSGILRSDDDGGSWIPMNNGLPNTTGVRAIATSGDVLLVGHNAGIYRSVDEGATWTPSNAGIPQSPQSAREFFHFNGVDLAVFSGTIADGGGIFRSSDGGINWSMGHSGMSTNMSVQDITILDGILFAATSVGLFRSSDLAFSWQSIPNSNYTTYAVQAVDDRLIVITSFGALYSDDQGGSWSPPATGISTNPVRAELAYFQGVVYAVVGSQFASQTYRSFDLGLSYSQFLDGLSSLDQQNQNTFHETSDRLYIGALMDAYWTDESTLGITNPAYLSASLLRPSLVENGFQLFTGKAAGSVVIYDVSGKEVHRSQISDAAQWIDVSAVPAGRYEVIFIGKSAASREHAGSIVIQR